MVNSIISNISALNAQGNINKASSSASASISRLSSGSAISKASDDVAGLATGTALRTQVTTLRTALQNASQGSSLLQVADGALSQIIDILQRQKAIATQASSGQLTDANRALLNQEFTALTSEVDRLATTTNFNGVNLLAGGLGSKTSLSRTDAQSAAAVIAAPTLGGANVTASTVAVQAFSTQTGGLLNVANTAGNLIVSDSTGALLANGAYLSADQSLYGQFSNFTFSNVTYGAVGTGSATLNATINGVTYSGSVLSNAGAQAVTLQNGNYFIRLGVTATSFVDSAATENSRVAIVGAFANTTITRIQAIAGADFANTTLSGISGTAAHGVAAIRLTNSGAADIGNFQYIANTGAANTSTLTVQINGTTFTATNVKDSITAGGSLQFSDAAGVQVLSINTTGLTTATGNIRTDLTARAAVLSALNTAFSKAGSGLNFSIGSSATDQIRVSFGSATTNSIYSGNTLDITTAANATAASAVLDNALTAVVSLRASVGALQSRFNFASNAIQSSIENQDAARAVFLDTDVSSESTKFASAQVQLQAGIAVLAQANQLPQTLLKLIQ